MSTTSQLPIPGRLFADMLWNTTRLPDRMNADPTKNRKRTGLAASIDGTTFSTGSNPTSEAAMISIISIAMAGVIYNESGGFDCKDPVNCVGGCRYVIFGGNGDADPGTQRQLADILELSPTGATIYFGQVDWRAGPDYNPGPLAT